MRDEDRGSARAPRVRDQRGDQVNAFRIETRVGLVEEQQLGPDDSEPREREATLHARGEAASTGVCLRPQPDGIEGGVDRARIEWASEHSQGESQILRRGQVRVDGVAVTEQADATPHRVRVA